MKIRPIFSALLLSVLPALAQGSIVLQAPANGEMISTVKPELRAFLQMPQAERREYFSVPENRTILNKARDANPYAFKWVCTEGESGAFTVVISEREDFSEPSPALVLSQDRAQSAENNDNKQARYEAGVANFLIGKTYYWKVVCKTADGREVVSNRGTFQTDPTPPRLLRIPKVENVRDLGGYVGLNGKKIRQGMILRSAGLNHNSPDFSPDPKKAKKERIEDYRVGATMLTPEGVAYINDVLGWRTDLDLRSRGEVASMKESPAGPKLQWINNKSSDYGAIFGKGGNCQGSGPEAMAKNFRVFCNRSNYPINFHCIAGADRTGALAYVLGGVLGVEKDELEKDWLISAKEYFKFDTMFDKLAGGFDNFGEPGDPLHKKVEAYLNKLGVTDEEIAQFRAIMLED